MKYKVMKKQNNSASCIVCGVHNKSGLHTFFYELENNELVALSTIKEHHQSYPNRAHGGIISSLLDETIGRAIMIKHQALWGVTIELNVKYKKPVPLNEPLKIIGRITKDTSRIFEGTGEILLPNGNVAAIATGRYMKMPLEKISNTHFVENEWFLVKTDKDPEYIEY